MGLRLSGIANHGSEKKKGIEEGSLAKRVAASAVDFLLLDSTLLHASM